MWIIGESKGSSCFLGYLLALGGEIIFREIPGRADDSEIHTGKGGAGHEGVGHIGLAMTYIGI